MPQTVGYSELVRMLASAARAVKENHELLSRLDSCGGDGDHGATMKRAMGTLEQVIADDALRTTPELLDAIGWSIMGVDGGATGPLFGSFFIGMAGAAKGKERLGTGELAALFEAGLAAVRKYTRADVGDKTMMDALIPAVESLRRAADEGADPATAFDGAAAAAEAGARSTAGLRARFGRAKNVGERSVGHQDPGAVSVSLLVGGMAEGIGRTDGEADGHTEGA